MCGFVVNEFSEESSWRLSAEGNKSAELVLIVSVKDCLLLFATAFSRLHKQENVQFLSYALWGPPAWEKVEMLRSPYMSSLFSVYSCSLLAYGP